MARFRSPKSGQDWFAVVAGLLVLGFSGEQLVLGLYSLSWPVADAVVVYSTPYRQFRTYRVDLRYDYSYQGRKYLGTRYRFQFLFARNSTRSRDVDLVQARYPVGERVTAAVNPSDPADAVLVPGTDFEAFCWAGFGLVLIAGGLVDAPRRKRKAAPQAAAPVPRPRSRAAGWLFAIGGALLAYGSWTLYTAWASQSWPVAEGRILYSQVRTGGQTAQLQLLYEYYAGGVRYVGTDYRAGGNSTPFKDVALAAARRYPAGKVLPVHYNPMHAADAVLEPGLWYGNFVIPAIGLLVLGIAWVARAYAAAVARQGRR